MAAQPRVVRAGSRARRAERHDRGPAGRAGSHRDHIYPSAAEVRPADRLHIIDRPGDVFFGVAEAAQGPTGAALANAIRDATGQRLRDLPFTWSASGPG
jgi:CO/xanthine dehydrogenase Mo-binding subunit